MAHSGLGFWAVAGASSATAGSYELISTTVLGATAASVTFSAIPQTYKSLELRIASIAGGSQGGAMQMQMNGVTTGSYATHLLSGYFGNVGSSSTISNTNMFIAGPFVGGYNAYPLSSITSILDYASTAKNKTIKSLGGIVATGSSSAEVNLISGVWMSTSAVTSLTILSGGGNYGIGSRFSLYGIKG